MKLKKTWAILLAAALAASVSACGNTGSNDTSSKDDTSKKETTESKSETQAETSAASSGKTLDAGLWTLNYDPDVWSYDEEDAYMDEEYAKATFMIPEGEDSYVANVLIKVTIDGPGEFRDDLKSCGFDQYEYAVNNAYDTVKIGGVDCLMQETESWGETCVYYIARDEAASVSVYIEVNGETEDERVKQLLDSLVIKTEDIGNEDGPWYWEGEPFSASALSAMAGTVTVNSQWLPITECIVTDETFDHSVAVVGDKAYILGDGTLKQYAYDGESLKFESEIECGEDYSIIQATNDGSIWISGFGENLVSYKDGVQTASYEDTDTVSMHPSGEWGIDWFSSSECEKITLSNGTISSSPITFAEVSTISSIIIDNDYIYVCGYATDESGHKVYVYNADGVLQKTLTDAEGEALGSITFMAQTSNGFLGFDGNMREIVLWTKDGVHIGTIEDSDLFGTSYPWFCGSTMLSDGNIVTVMTQERADESAMELVAFRLSGF